MWDFSDRAEREIKNSISIHFNTCCLKLEARTPPPYKLHWLSKETHLGFWNISEADMDKFDKIQFNFCNSFVSKLN